MRFGKGNYEDSDLSLFREDLPYPLNFVGNACWKQQQAIDLVPDERKNAGNFEVFDFQFHAQDRISVEPVRYESWKRAHPPGA